MTRPDSATFKQKVIEWLTGIRLRNLSRWLREGRMGKIRAGVRDLAGAA